jgi:branched-chain amino acid transport system ATP-binding protein
MSREFSAMPLPLLQVGKLIKRFGGFYALNGVSFHLLPGEVLGLVGPNGSGKTTCINILSGLIHPDGGEVVFDGKLLDGLPSYRRVHRGINRTFQVPKPFATLTVCENVEIAATYGRRNSEPADIDAILASLDLDTQQSRAAADLNSVQQKMLDLARALATAPRLLLVDELAAGLHPGELDLVARKLRELAKSGIALLVVEHLMDFIGEVTDRVIVLDAGRAIFEGTLDQAVHDRQVVEVFLGGTNHGG